MEDKNQTEKWWRVQPIQDVFRCAQEELSIVIEGANIVNADVDESWNRFITLAEPVLLKANTQLGPECKLSLDLNRSISTQPDFVNRKLYGIMSLKSTEAKEHVVVEYIIANTANTLTV